MSQEEKETTPPEGTKFYAAILQADGSFAVETFDTAEQLVAQLKRLIDRDVSVFSFAGAQLRISKPPFRHLLTPWGAHPLFDIPTRDFEVDDTGYLGLDPIHIGDPPQIKSPKQQTNFSGEENEFFDDKDDNSLGVFDNILPDPDN
jgi:hypothetical protein